MSREGKVRLVATDNPAAGGDSMYVVDLYENGKFVTSRSCPGKSRYWAEDLAENWETGVYKLLTENNTYE